MEGVKFFCFALEHLQSQKTVKDTETLQFQVLEQEVSLKAGPLGLLLSCHINALFICITPLNLYNSAK